MEHISLIILDLYMPFISGKELLKTINLSHPQIPVIVMTAADDVDTAIDCMKSGAFDFLVKPVENARLITSVKKALEIRDLNNEVTQLREHLLLNKVKQTAAFESIITTSPKMSSMFQYPPVSG